VLYVDLSRFRERVEGLIELFAVGIVPPELLADCTPCRRMCSRNRGQYPSLELPPRICRRVLEREDVLCTYDQVIADGNRRLELRLVKFQEASPRRRSMRSRA